MSRLRMPVIAALATISVWVLGGITNAASAATITQIPCGRSLSSLRPAAGSTLELSRSRTGATVSLYGSHDSIKNLSLVGVVPGSRACGGSTTPAGHVDGIDIYAGATDNRITGVTATGFYAAVFIMTGASGNIVQNSTMKNNTELDTNSSSGSSGAFGVLLWGVSNTIRNNYINGNQACSLAYGCDGSAIEVYGGSNNVISFNTASNDNAFAELGSFSGHVASGNSFTGTLSPTATPGRRHLPRHQGLGRPGRPGLQDHGRQQQREPDQAR